MKLPLVMVCALGVLSSGIGLAADVPCAEPDGPKDLAPPAIKSGLLRNGSFEEGRWWPAGWDPVDKLGTIWADGGTDGDRCLRADTNLLESQWLPWNEQVLKLASDASAAAKDGDAQSLQADPIPDPPARLPTKPPYYNTVGGNHGIHYRSNFIKAEPRAIYRFSVDARCEKNGEPKVFLKGFFDQRRVMEQGEVVLKRNAYRADMTLAGCGPAWQKYVRIFHPERSTSTNAGKPLRVEWLRVELYAYWPAGVYEFDNARLEIIGYEDAPPPAPSAATPAPAKSEPVRNPDDEFPVLGK